VTAPKGHRKIYEGETKWRISSMRHVSLPKRQRLALRELDEARRVYRWWHLAILADLSALALTILSFVSLLVLMAGAEKCFALLILPFAGTFATLAHTHLWPPYKRAHTARRKALWEWEDAMMAEDEEDR
jgi:hypothetical protein